MSCLLLGAESRAAGGEVQFFSGMCDASAAVDAGHGRILVANDEDNTLRLYAVPGPGTPERSFDLDGFLRVEPDSPEADFEGAAATDGLVFWISSHGRNKSGKKRLSRHRFFATRIVWQGAECRVLPEGHPYTQLLEDFLADPRLASFGLRQASRQAPKDDGALNIEALAARPDGSLWIGFRNPIPGRRALAIPLLNPVAVTEGERARLGEPILVDLDGLGFRDLIRWEGGYLILAGSPGTGGRFQGFVWDGAQPRPRRIDLGLPADFSPEAALRRETSMAKELLVLSDDGAREVAGRACKDLDDPSLRSFRLVRLGMEVFP